MHVLGFVFPLYSDRAAPASALVLTRVTEWALMRQCVCVGGEGEG